MDEVEWIWTELTEQKRGDDPTSKAFEYGFRNLTRETIQNSLDAQKDSQNNPVELTYRLVKLQGSGKEKYLSTLNWESLNNHLDMLDSDDNQSLLEHGEKLSDPNEPIWLLNIEDNYTAGLSGNEFGEDSHFTDLCRNILKSSKSGDGGIGGSHGIGKTLLWMASGISTVLFNSVIHENPEESPRFIGSVNWPSHDDAEHDFYGPGWFGLPEEYKGEIKAHSLKALSGNGFEEFLRDLHIERDSVPGTNIQIVDFIPPDSVDDPSDPEEIAEGLLSSVAENCWPILRDDSESLDVDVIAEDENGDRINKWEVEERHYEEAEVTKYIECKEKYVNDDLNQELNQYGDVVREKIPVELPDTKDGKDGCTANADLLIRLSSENSDGNVDTMLYHRGPGIVVNKKSNFDLPIGSSSFHALLLCGLATKTKNSKQKYFDEFLKDAEPPAHDSWMNHENLREIYKQGYAKAKSDMFDRVEEEIQQHVQDIDESSGQGPKLLRKLFDVGKIGGGKEESYFSFRNRNANLDYETGKWEFSGEVESSKKIKGKWEAEIEVLIQGIEDESDFSVIDDFEVDSSGAEAIVEEGKAIVDVNKTVGQFNFHGTTDPDKFPGDPSESRIQMVITGSEKSGDT